MSTVTTFVTAAKAAKSFKGTNRDYVLANTIDFAKKGCASADVVQLFTVPAHTMVWGLYWRVLTAEGATCTGTLGDTTDPDGFCTSVNINSTSTEGYSALALTEGTPNTITGYTSGKLYTADTAISLVLANAAAAGKLVVKAFCTDLN